MPATTPVFTDADGRVCAVAVRPGAGRALVATAQLPASPQLMVPLLDWLGTTAGLRLRTTVPGVVATTGVTPRGERMLHLVNPTGFAATVRLRADDPTGLLDGPLALPARTGRMLPLGLLLPDGSTLVSANAEVEHVSPGRLRLGPALGGRTEAWLRPAGRVRCETAEVVAEGSLVRVLDPRGQPVHLTLS